MVLPSWGAGHGSVVEDTNWGGQDLARFQSIRDEHGGEAESPQNSKGVPDEPTPSQWFMLVFPAVVQIL